MDRDFVLVFKIQGDSFDPSEAQRQLCVEGAKLRIKGERRRNPDVPRTNVWSLESTSVSDDISDHWTELRARLEGASQLLEPLAAGGEALFTVYIYSRDRIPPVRLPVSMLRFAARIGAEIDLDHLQ